MNSFTVKGGDYYILGWGLGKDDNPGTMDAPKATFTIESNKKYVLRGTVEQNINITGGSTNSIIGDLDAKIKGKIVKGGSYRGEPKQFLIRNIDVDAIQTTYVDIENVRTTLKTFTELETIPVSYSCKNSILVLDGCIFLGSSINFWKNLTVRGFTNGCYIDSIVYDSIVFGDFDLYNYSNNWTVTPVFKYSLFLKDRTVFKWNGAVIPIAWTAPGNETQDVIDSLKAYAEASLTVANQKNYLNACADNLFGEGTVVYDDSPGHVRVFNAYDASGNPSDLNLNMENGNPALFISSYGDYVGALRPAFKIEWDWENMQSLDVDGNVIDETPDLLQENNGIFANIYSAQIRNRVTAMQVLAFPGGDRLSKIAADFVSAADRGIYFGAWQNETDGAVPVDAFEAVVYDTPAQPSAYPRLLIPFNKNLEIAYFKTGDKAGQPVLFSDLADLGIETNKNLTEVAGWAITTGAVEFGDVTALENIEAKKPAFRYILPVLTANKQG
ncbi:MAG: hypothetical protein LBL79_09690 [Prevotella sp.]|jgi:hypothetical protein|nr:hypothetical protein [Prevotella sp.]